MGKKAIVEIEKVYQDGSGAPASVLCQGFYFGADMIGGEIRLYAHATCRHVPRRVIESAKRQYKQALLLHRDYSADWLEKNVAMYRGSP